MTLTLGTSGGNKDVSSITLGASGGNKSVQEGWIGTSGGNKQFFSALSAQITPSSMQWVIGGGGYISLFQFIATPVGGTAPYTYLWETTGDCTFDFPTAANTGEFSVTGDTQDVRCKVTDNNGNSAYTPYATISL